MKPPRLLLNALSLSLCLLMLCGSGLAATEAEKPNVLLILTDDHGFGDIGYYGNRRIDTPRLDALARESVRMERFYVSPVCAPTRASLLTGRYHPATGAVGVTRRLEVMRPEEYTLAEAFRDNGYRTACIGKWHNGAYYPETPTAQGFDTFVGFPYGHTTRYFDPELWNGDEPRQMEGYITDLLGDAALEFIDQATAEGSPFFCYVPFNAPHTPALLPKELYEKYRAMGMDESQAAVYGMMEVVDRNVGRLLDRLEERGLAENTIVIFMADNGPTPVRYNRGLRERKAGYHDGGVRVPFFLRWPERLDRPGSLQTMLAHIDVFPTLVELCGLELEESPEIHGRSFASLLFEPQVPWPDRLIHIFPFGPPEDRHIGGGVRTERWSAVKSRGTWALYDMQSLWGEYEDVGEQYPWVLDALSEGYEEALEEYYPADKEPTPIPVGYAGHPEVLAEAHEAELMDEGKSGGIGYNFPAGFAHHWVTGWTDAEDYAQWRFDVVAGGRYELALQYWSDAQPGSVEGYVAVAGEELPFVMEERFAPPSYKQPFVIAGNASKYESRLWAFLKVGTVEIPEEVVTITVHLTAVPEAGRFDLKGLRLVKVE